MADLRVSICEFTTVGASFEEDLDAYRAAGAEGIGICEFKLGDDAVELERLRRSGLRATHCVPAVPSILPLPLMEGPAHPEERVEAICSSVRRLAAYDPVCVHLLTGPRGDLADAEARGIAVDGLRRIADEAERVRVVMALEPIQREFAHFWTLVSTLRDAQALILEAERPSVRLLFDTWHLWNDPGLGGDISRFHDRLAGVHVADWREDTRNTNDRALPGDGVADLPGILGALDGAGYDGWYDVEIFSDAELPDSLWKLDPGDLAARAVESLRSVWSRRMQPSLDEQRR
ncbi:MAG: sugar phosphate isomerase/epimerase [Actinomycetota bacterium]|nr:sugar phosphate isomerase/epimerase [Actinomycetota bacterium]